MYLGRCFRKFTSFRKRRLILLVFTAFLFVLGCLVAYTIFDYSNPPNQYAHAANNISHDYPGSYDPGWIPGFMIRSEGVHNWQLNPHIGEEGDFGSDGYQLWGKLTDKATGVPRKNGNDFLGDINDLAYIDTSREIRDIKWQFPFFVVR